MGTTFADVQILAFLSTCKRVRDSVKPFGLIWSVTIDERERARDWIGCVPERLRPGISRLDLFCYREMWPDKRHRTVPRNNCIATYAAKLLPHLPCLETMSLSTTDAMDRGMPEAHQCEIGQIPTVSLPKMKNVALDHCSLHCMSAASWLQISDQGLHSLHLTGRTLLSVPDNRCRGLATLVSSKIFALDNLRVLQVPASECSNSIINIHIPSILKLGRMYPDLVEFGLTTSSPSFLCRLEVERAYDRSLRHSQSVYRLDKRSIPDLSSFANLRRIGPLFSVALTTHSSSKLWHPLVGVVDRNSLQRLKERYNDHLLVQREHIRSGVEVVARALQVACPSLESGGVWIQIGLVNAPWWWWEWHTVVAEDGQKLIRVDPSGIPGDMLD